MTTMLEKAALAMFRAWNDPEGPHDEEIWAATREDYVTALRAALQAIREPSEAVQSVAKYDEYDWAGRNFTAMIDAILEGKA